MVSDNEYEDSTCATPIKISQDCNIYVTELDNSQTLSFPMKAARQAYLLCMEGQISLQIENSDQSEISLKQHDAAEIFITDGTNLIASTTTSSPAHLLMVEMVFTGRGRSDI